MREETTKVSTVTNATCVDDGLDKTLSLYLIEARQNITKMSAPSVQKKNKNVYGTPRENLQHITHNIQLRDPSRITQNRKGERL